MSIPSRITPDGSSSSTLYNRNFWTETDPAGRSRTTTTDGLDRLAAVAENNLGTPATTLYNTAYSYDILGDLVQVNQSGQTRCAYYDELKRVKATANPETSPANTTCSPGTLPSTATTTYTYDNNGNVLTKTSPAGIVTNLAPPGSPIDALNRVTQKTYSDGTPTASFSYDSCEGGVGRLCGSNAANSNGFSSALSFTYDSLGRAAGSTQTTNGIPYAFSYTWNLLDGPITIAYPSHRLVTYNYDSDGRVNTITGAATPTAMPTTYVKSVQWAPQTAPSLVSLGNGLVQQYCYNNRLQVAGIRTGATEGTDCSNQSGDLFQLALNYNNGTNNGNLWGQTQKVPNDDGSVLTLTEVYNYDAVNRLQSANESSGTSSWNVGFGYDPFGNQWLSSSTIPTPVSAPVQQSQFDATTNRIVNQPNGQPMPADAYDADGNLRDHPMVGQMSYDAEGRLTQFSNAGLVSRFWYDAVGHRVLKTTGANSTSYVYDASGDLIAEYGTPSAASGTQFLTTDHLGSTRLVTDAYGLRQSCADYFPFGGEIATDLPGQIRAGASCYTAMSKPTEKFTGKERDSESGLDYFGARYYGSALGRFTSPDEPFADQHAGEPQSWNLYGYVRNNPLANIDPLGLDCISTSQSGNTLTVTTTRGGTSGGCSGTFVDGTVNADSISYKNGAVTWTDNTATGGGAISVVAGSAPAPDISPFGAAVVRSVGARTDASYQLLGIAAGGSVALGAGGGAACYYYCEWLADLFGEALTNQEAGNVIGWGKGQVNASATRDLARGLTRSAVETMKRNGLTKNTVKQLLQKYEAAEIKAAANGTANTQLPERIELMRTILKLW